MYICTSIYTTYLIIEIQISPFNSCDKSNRFGWRLCEYLRIAHSMQHGILVDGLYVDVGTAGNQLGDNLQKRCALTGADCAMQGR